MSREAKIAKALTIAGSDSMAGAGVQSDLKTFASLGVYGMSVITALTAQNTSGILGVWGVPSKFVGLQIDAVAKDVGVDAAKTGMLYEEGVVKVVAEKARSYKFPLVVDPVAKAKSGFKLLKDGAMELLIERLLPMATVATPNIPEAEALARLKISSVKDMEEAAGVIARYGVKAVVVKGGHMPIGGRVIDILYFNNEVHRFERGFIKSETTHGTGCSFSAAITALIARGYGIPEAVEEAGKFVHKAVKFGFRLKEGKGSVNPMAQIYNKAEKLDVLDNVKKALRIVEASPELLKLLPEVGMNIAMATSYAEGLNDVCAVEGRIWGVDGRLKALGCPWLGASKHMASVVLTAMSLDPEVRAAMNIRYGGDVVEACLKNKLTISSFKREEEPPEVKDVEGFSLPWGVKEAFKKAGGVTDVVYDLGAFGKEAMVRILGRSAVDVVEKALRIARSLPERSL